MKKFPKISFLATLLLLSVDTFAQSGMEEYFYASGKIKVVIAVAAVVLIGIVVYLVSLDRRLKKLEKKK
ncbi:MAG TPA: CcmD family protein [Flavobacteriales bacterium]